MGDTLALMALEHQNDVSIVHAEHIKWFLPSPETLVYVT